MADERQFSDFTDEAQWAMATADKLARSLGDPAVGTPHLFTALLDGDALADVPKSVQLLLKLGNDSLSSVPAVRTLRNRYRDSLPTYRVASTATRMFTAELQTALTKARQIAAANSEDGKVDTDHLLLGVLSADPEIEAYIGEESGVTLAELKAEFEGVRDGAVENMVVDLTDLAARGLLSPTLGRDAVIQRVIEGLKDPNTPSVALIGEAGVGKTQIAEGIAQRIAEGLVDPQFRGKRVLSVHLGWLSAGTKYRGEFEEKLKRVVDAVKEAGDILFIDELHTIVGTGSAGEEGKGSPDAAQLLKSALSRGEICCIGATTPDEYRRSVEQDGALDRRFLRVPIGPMDRENTLQVLHSVARRRQGAAPGLVVDTDAAEAAYDLAVRYVPGESSPGGPIKLFNAAANRAVTDGPPPELLAQRSELQTLREERDAAGDTTVRAGIEARIAELTPTYESAKSAWLGRTLIPSRVSRQTIAAIVHEQRKIPMERILGDQQENLRTLAPRLKSGIIGQSQSADLVARELWKQRDRAAEGDRRPVRLTFIGTTGVGKTTMARAVAREVFGTESALIEQDMSGFGPGSVSRLVGADPGTVGYREGNNLAEKVRLNPSSVLLFDEFDRADATVWGIYSQILENGFFIDSQGRNIDCSNCIVIMASNLGAEELTKKVLGFQPHLVGVKAETPSAKLVKGLANSVPEASLGRMNPVPFNRMTKDDLTEIVATLRLPVIETTLAGHGYTVVMDTPAVASAVATFAETDALRIGARALHRHLDATILDPIATLELNGALRAGDTVRIGVDTRGMVVVTTGKLAQRTKQKPLVLA